jgi:membrane glycosyltransferase
MRLGMRSHTLGAAWWQGDCGPYWGHNAILRLKPFAAHCRLPVLPQGGPLGGHVLSHDQIEAALMRRAGYEVRVIPAEGISWEENPPTLMEFIRRELRWCQGNMQYFWLLGLPGLKPVSRFQLVLAILMYLGSPAWMALLAVGSLAVGLAGTSYKPETEVRPAAGAALFAVMLLMIFAPKIATGSTCCYGDLRGATARAAFRFERRGRDLVFFCCHQSWRSPTPSFCSVFYFGTRLA